MARRERPERRGTVALAAGVLLALVAAMLPATRVIAPGWWMASAVGLAAAILALGVLVRRMPVPAVLATLVGSLTWVIALTVLFFPQTAVLGVLPAPATLRQFPAMFGEALQQMAGGTAPLPATPALAFFLVAAVGALAVMLDHVVLTTRMPLLGAVALLAVMLMPAIAVPAPMDAGALVLLAAAVLFLLRTEARTRVSSAWRRRAPAPAGRSATASLSAVAIGAAAVVLALVATPLLPAPTGGSLPGGSGASAGIDPTLRLGDDLRRPTAVEVLQVRGSASGAAYLRAATLSTFAGDVWRPDEATPEPLDAGFGALPAAEGVEIEEAETHVSVGALASPFLPVPFPATSVEGVTGDWGAVAANRTVVGLGTDASGQAYTVRTAAALPSLEQIRGASTDGADDALRAVPEGTPASVATLAAEVTAGTTNDYDAAAALQRWFRSNQFAYSLDAPVEDGFDGPGVEAIGQFLEQREGYCVHFASAFALMTRSLGMPTRIVVGYLPGSATGDSVGGELVYAVMSDQLHAWPEVFFDGIGWIGFEPTNSLGAPPAFASTGGAPVDPLAEDTAPEDPVEAPAPAEPVVPEDEAVPDAGAAPADAAAETAGARAVLVILGVLILASAPGVARRVRDAARLAAARRGDEMAAWAVVRDTAVDLGIPTPPSETPRAFAARLEDRHGAPPEALGELVRAVEQASYGPPGLAATGRGGRSMAVIAAAARVGLLTAAPRARRVFAVVAPRSLVPRNGSAPGSDGEADGASGDRADAETRSGAR